MARRITFEVVTKAQTRELKTLADLLSQLAKDSAAFNRQTNLNKLGEEITALGRSARETSTALGVMGRRLEKDLGDQSDRAEKNVETLQTRMRGLSGDISKLDSARRRMKTIADQSTKAEEALADATTRTAEAQRRLRDVQRRPDATEQDVREATDAYKDSAKALQRAETQVRNYRETWRKTSQDILDAERNIRDIERGLHELSQTADGRNKIKEWFGADDIAQLERGKDAIRSVQSVMNTMGKERDSLNRMQRGVETLGTSLKNLAPAVDIVRNLGTELRANARLDVADLRRSLGNTDSAVRQTAQMFSQQGEQAIKLRGEMDRLNQATARWATAESEVRGLVNSGNTALLERQRVQRLMTTAIRNASSVETTALKQREQLLAQQRRLQEEQLSLTNRINAAQTNLARQTAGTASQREAEGHLNRLRAAYTQLDQAIDQNTTNIRENANVIRTAGAQVEQMERSTHDWRAAIQSMVTASGRNPFQDMIRSLQDMNNFAMRMARTLTSNVRNAITTVASAARSFVGSSGQIFSGLQRAIQSTGSLFERFAGRVEASMRRAHESMLEMYAAGYALMSIGRDIQQFGMQGFRMMSMNLDRFMEYERARTVAGIAGAQPVDAQGNILPQTAPNAASFTINSKIIDQLVFALQRGTMIPAWMEGQRGRLPVTFDATELAQGLYYFSSAIGVPINQENMEDIGGVVNTMMQMARVTNTGVETATKGILNIAMEFGYDPRLIGSDNPAERAQAATDLAKLTAQVGYLSNISTMEVSDIIETFKMVGPMANVLSGGAPGAGLNETFLMAFLASEVGLRGGNTGRGINRAFSSLLDPSDKMIEIMGKYFEDVVDAESFRDRFFDNVTGGLKGGIMGFMETLATIPENLQAQAIAELFTENASRVLIGTIDEFTKEGGLQEWLDSMAGQNPFRWLEAAAAESANTISGWFQFMQNGWFQFTRAMTQSIQGPLMAGFQLVGEFLFALAERIDKFPAIGQTIAAVVTSILSLAAVGGTILMIAGGILLLGRSFAMLGGYVMPFIRLIGMAGLTLIGLLPLLALIGTAIGLVVLAVRNNVAGLGDAFNAITGFFSDFEGNIVPFIENLFDTMARFGDAIRIFFESILLGGDLPANSINNLFAGIRKIFGDLLGNEIINRLMALRANLEPIRQSLRDFFSRDTFDVSALREAGDAVRGFLEVFALGRMSNASMQGISRIGAALGIDNLVKKIFDAATAMRAFAGDAVNAAFQIASAWVQMSGQIYSNLARIFGGNLQGIFRGLGAVLQGMFQGVLLAVSGVLAGIAFVTDKIADFAEGLRSAEAAGRQFLGMTVTFEGVLRGIGTAIGLFLGARLVMAFSPLAGVLATVIPLLANMSAVVVGIGGRFLILAAQIAITTAAFVAQIAVSMAYAGVMAFLTAAKFALAVATTGLTAAQSGATASTGALGMATAIVSGAMGILTGTTAIAAGTMSALAAIATVAAGIFIVVAGAVFLVVAALAGFAALVTAIAAAMIVWVGVTQGVGAALSALGSFLSGVWSGLQAGIAVLETFLSAVSRIAGMIGSILGVGNAFRTMGLMVGLALSGILILITALMTALAVLGGAFVLLVAVTVGPIILLGLAFKTLYDTIAGIDWAGAIQALPDALQVALVGVSEILDQISMKFVDSINTIIDGINLIGNAGDAIGVTVDDIPHLPDVDISGQIQDWRKTQELLGGAGQNQQTLLRLRVDVDDDGKVNDIMNFLDTIGVGGYAREFMISIGLDPDSLSFDDLSPDNILKFFETPEGMKFDAEMMDFGFGDVMDKYQKDMNAWKLYKQRVDAGADPMATRRFLEANGIQVPDEKPDFMTYFNDIVGDVEAGGDAVAQAFEEQSQKWKEAAQSWMDMSAPDMFKALYDPLGGGSSIIGFLSGISDQIIQAAQSEGGGQWLNFNELIADIAGTGVNLDEGLIGRNLHTALRPAFQILSDQTGVAIETLMAEIPIFQAPEEYQAIASVDLAQGITAFVDQFGTDVYQQVDTALAGITGANGEQFFQYGLDWSELNNFAIGQAILGYDWTLADFVAEVMDITTEQANQVLLDAGISQEAINAFSQNMYDGVSEAVLSNAGAYNVLTQEQFQWLSDATQGFTSNVIQMTESEFGKMSDTMKLILTNMGYTFVITDVVPPEAIEKAKRQIQEFADVVQSLPTYLGREGANYVMEGDVEDWLPVGKITDAAGNIKYVLEDLDGTQVHIPAAEWYDYQASLLAMQNYTEQAIAAIRTGWAAIDRGYVAQGTGLVSGGIASNLATKAGGTGPNEGPTMAALGLLPEVTVKVKADTAEASKAVNQLKQDLGGGEGGQAVTVKISADTAEFSSKVQSIVESVAGINQALEITIKINVDTTEYAAAMQSIVESVAGINQALNVKIKVSADVASFAASMAGISTAAALIPPIKVKVQADMENFWSTITATASGNAGGGPMAGQASSVKVPVIGTIKSIEQTVGAATPEVEVVAIVTQFIKETNGDVTVDVVAVVTSFESEVLSGANIRMPVTAYVNAFESDVLTGANIRMPVTAYVNAFESDVLMGANIRMPVTAYVNAFESDVLTGANVRMPVTAYVNSVEMDALFTMSLRIPVVAEVTQTGADTVIAQIGGATSAAEAFAVTWTATISQSGAEGAATSIGNTTGVANNYAKTYTAMIRESGAAAAATSIGNATGVANNFAKTYTATINVNDNASSAIGNAIGLLNRFDGMSATATMTTVNRTVNETVSIGGNTMTAATGGWRAGGQAVLVGEEGPEVVYFPRDGYVFTAPETNRMLSEPEFTNPFLGRGGDDQRTISVSNTNTNNTYNFYGDINIADQKTARAWFDEMDRRQGNRVALAKRGMLPTDDTNLW